MLVATGTVLVVAGMVLLFRTNSPSLPLAMLGWHLFLITVSSLVPAGWIAAGVAAMLAGAGLRAARWRCSLGGRWRLAGASGDADDEGALRGCQFSKSPARVTVRA